MSIEVYKNIPPVTPALRREMLMQVIRALGDDDLPWIIVSPAPVRFEWKKVVDPMMDEGLIKSTSIHFMTMRAVRTGPLVQRSAILVDDCYPDQKVEFRRLVERLQKASLGMRVFTMFPAPPEVPPADQQSIDDVKRMVSLIQGQNKPIM